MRTIAALSLITASAFGQAPAEFHKPKEISPGLFEIGTVKLDQNARTVNVPAKVNMVDGLIEYLMVTPQGSVHESVLVSESEPQDVHMAMTLLGAKGMVAPKDEGAAPPRIDAEYLAKAPKLTGDKISLKVTWKDTDGTEKSAPLEKWILRRIAVPKKAAREVVAEEGPWLYTGSFFHEGRFIAQVEGVFGSVVTFPGALINNPREGSVNDQMWFVNKAGIPPKDTPVTLTIKLEDAKAQPAKESKDSKKESSK